MEVLLLRKPYEVSFSGNPVAFTFIVTPYTEIEHGQDIGLNVTIEVEESFNTQLFTSARQNIYLPDPQGIVEIDIQHILQAYLTQYIPSLTLSTHVPCDGQNRRYRLSYQLIVNGNIDSQVAATDIFNVIKGGMPYEEWHPKKYFSQYVSSQKLFLRYSTAEEKVHADEIKFLNWIYPLVSQIQLKLLATVYYHDNSQEQKDLSGLFLCYQWQIYITPAGFKQLGLDTLATDSRIPLYYEIAIVDAANGVIGAPQRFVLDYRNFYNTYNIMYAGSLGGIETLRLRGQVEAQAEYTRTIAERVTPSDYFTGGILQSPVATSYASENEKFTGDTGFISKEKLDRLRDIFLSRDCLFEIRAGKLLPVAIDGKSVKLYTTTDKLYSMSLDWRNAFNNQYYAPDNLLSVVSLVCPVTAAFYVRQVQKSYLQILWALEPEYNQVQIEIPGNTGLEIITLSGNTGQERIFFKNPRIDQPDNISPIIIKARTVCDASTNPVSVSAWVQESLNLFVNFPPVAIDDNFTFPRGITTMTQLDGNLLANDYDPDGDAIMCQAVNNAPTVKGGRITITTDGKPAYSAPSSVFEGEDSYTYTIQEVAQPSATATAVVRITVGNPATGSVVYARIVLRNVVGSWQTVPKLDGGFEPRFVTKGQVWIDFFADPIGTVPVDVTSLNLSINYQALVKYENPATTSTNNKTVTGKGEKTMIHQDTLSVQYGTGTFTNFSIEFKLAAGTGYSIL